MLFKFHFGVLRDRYKVEILVPIPPKEVVYAAAAAAAIMSLSSISFIDNNRRHPNK